MPSTTVKREIEIEFDAIRVIAALHDGDRDMPLDAPFRNGDTWDVTIDLFFDDDAKIRNWPQGKTLDIHAKVCDCGTYIALKRDKEVGRRENNYVPDCFPDQHYGDYLILNIDADGRITNWESDPDWNDLIPSDE